MGFGTVFVGVLECLGSIGDGGGDDANAGV